MFKNIIISAERQKQELVWILGCFCIAFLMNVVAIIVYKTQWAEIFTQLLWVLIITGLLYALSIVVRLLVYAVKRLFVRK